LVPLDAASLPLSQTTRPIIFLSERCGWRDGASDRHGRHTSAGKVGLVIASEQDFLPIMFAARLLERPRDLDRLKTLFRVDVVSVSFVSPLQSVEAGELQGRALRRAMELVTLSWVFGSVWATAIGGAPFSLFARHLGASEFQIGVLA